MCLGESVEKRLPQLDIDLIMDQIMDAFFAVDTEWRFTYLNDLACQFLRRERGTLIGRRIWDEFPEALGIQFELQYRKAIEEQVVVQFEEFFQPLETWFEVRAYPFGSGIYVYFRDITVKKRMQQEIEQNHRIVSHAQRVADIGIWEWDIARNIIYWSDGAYTIGRHPRMTGSFDFYINHLVHEGDREMVNEAIQNALSGDLYDVEYRLVRPDGEIRTVHSHGHVVYDNAEQPLKMIGIAQDVTNHRETERHLRESEERYRSLVENSLNVIAVNDGKQWLYMNQAGLKLFGASGPEDVVGKPIYDFLHPDYHAQCLERTNAIVNGRKPVSLSEQKWYTLTGSMIVTEVLAVPVTFENQPVVQLIIRDISERRHAEQLLIQSEKLSAIGQLAAAVAHEVRNPLTSLKGFLQLLRSKSCGGNTQYFDIMEQEVAHIEMISSEMLMLAKPQAMSFGMHDVKAILCSVVTLLEPQALMKNVEIVTEYGEVPHIQCVEHAIKQVFVNLVKNSIEAMSDKGGQIVIRLTNEFDHVFIQVTDEGCGIPEELLAQIGQPFFTTKSNGTGLGLMVIKRIVENHRGTIHLTSQTGVGTTVQVRLPQTSITQTSSP